MEKRKVGRPAGKNFSDAEKQDMYRLNKKTEIHQLQKLLLTILGNNKDFDHLWCMKRARKSIAKAEREDPHFNELLFMQEKLQSVMAADDE